MPQIPARELRGRMPSPCTLSLKQRAARDVAVLKSASADAEAKQKADIMSSLLIKAKHEVAVLRKDSEAAAAKAAGAKTAAPDFQEDGIVWAKCGSYPWWPAKARFPARPRLRFLCPAPSPHGRARSASMPPAPRRSRRAMTNG